MTNDGERRADPSKLSETDILSASLERLRSYVEREKLKGYDPYDVLSSPLPVRAIGHGVAVLATQVYKWSPFNLRRLTGVPKEHNPKAMGLLLHAYSILARKDSGQDYLQRARELFDWLISNQSAGYSGYCWGYNFDWSSPAKFVPASTPSSVVTGFIAKGIHCYYQASGDGRAVNALRQCSEFVLNDLQRTGEAGSFAFSYTPLHRDCCYNASLLAAETLIRTFAVTGEERLRIAAAAAVDFVVERQHADGYWNYSRELNTPHERRQIDFHQGYILDSIQAYVTFSEQANERLLESLHRGAAFYAKKQFTSDGRSMWRLPRRWPIDIHHQAQGVLTFARLANLDSGYETLSRSIATWTIAHMQGADGHFFYQLWPGFANRISYMRWGQAWMMLALATLISEPSRRL